MSKANKYPHTTLLEVLGVHYWRSTLVFFLIFCIKHYEQCPFINVAYNMFTKHINYTIKHFRNGSVQTTPRNTHGDERPHGYVIMIIIIKLGKTPDASVQNGCRISRARPICLAVDHLRHIFVRSGHHVLRVINSLLFSARGIEMSTLKRRAS